MSFADCGQVSTLVRGKNGMILQPTDGHVVTHLGLLVLKVPLCIIPELDEAVSYRVSSGLIGTEGINIVSTPGKSVLDVVSYELADAWWVWCCQSLRQQGGKAKIGLDTSTQIGRGQLFYLVGCGIYLLLLSRHL